VDLESSALKPSRAFAPMVRHLCGALVEVNRIILRQGTIPELYASGVRYRREPGHWVHERFDNAQTCFGRGWGDCDDLASWRCAELLNRGVTAGIIVSWKPVTGGRLYHVKVRTPPGIGKMNPQTGQWEEDPSLILGMKP
jgi:hypothetical protein